MILTLLALVGVSAAFPIVAPANLPASPATVTLFAPAMGQPVSSMANIQDVFGMGGLPLFEDAFDGLVHTRDDERHAYVYDFGGAAYHDLSVLKSRMAIEPRPAADVTSDALSLLEELGLSQVDNIELVPGPVGKATLTRKGPQGQVFGPVVTHQKASFMQVVDGLPGFGGGAEVDVIYGAGGELGALSHAVRQLDEVGTAGVIPASQALSNFRKRATESRINLHRYGLGSIESVSLRSLTLGYYIPDTSVATDIYEPVYEVLGTVKGTDPLGRAVSVELLWYEPAIVGHDLVALEINSVK